MVVNKTTATVEVKKMVWRAVIVPLAVEECCSGIRMVVAVALLVVVEGYGSKWGKEVKIVAEKAEQMVMVFVELAEEVEEDASQEKLLE